MRASRLVAAAAAVLSWILPGVASADPDLGFVTDLFDWIPAIFLGLLSVPQLVVVVLYASRRGPGLRIAVLVMSIIGFAVGFGLPLWAASEGGLMTVLEMHRTVLADLLVLGWAIAGISLYAVLDPTPRT